MNLITDWQFQFYSVYTLAEVKDILPLKGACMNFNIQSILLKDKRVMQEINDHLWIESQKAGYNIGMDRAAEEWVRLYAAGWTKYNWPEFYTKYYQ